MARSASSAAYTFRWKNLFGTGQMSRWGVNILTPPQSPCPPLPEREVGTLEGEQERLFEGGDDAL